jgi:tetratricopeptide (TPR) repeat protein
MANLIGKPDVADAIWEQSLEIFRTLGDEQGIAIILHRLSMTPLVRHDWARTRSLAEDSLERHRRIGDRKGETQNLAVLAIVLREEGDLGRAYTLVEQSIAIADDIGFRWWSAGARAIAATVLLALGRTVEARTWAREALSIAHEIADRTGIPSALALLAEIAKAEGNGRRAGTLFGAVEAEVERTPTPPWLFAPIERGRILAAATLEFERGRADGRSLPVEDALALALEDDGEAAAGPALARNA